MTKNEYLIFLSMNNWVNLKRLIQMALDDEYERMKQFDYPKINVNDIIDYLKDKYLDLFYKFMKKEVWKPSIEEVSIEEVARDFCEECGLSNLDIKDFDSELNYFIEDNIKEISPEERATLEEEIKKFIIEQKEEIVAEEKHQLKDRKSILEWLDNYIGNDDFLEEGNVGYYLSAREILDLIIKNGQK